MKKFLIFVVLLTVALASSAQLWAEESKEDKVSTLIILKNDFYEKFQIQKAQFYFHKDWLGGGFDVDLIRQSDFLKVRPYVTVNSGPWYFLAGASYANANGKISEHAQIGVWYINKFGDWSVIADMRNYFGLNQNALAFSDNFFEITHPIGKDKKWFVGLDVVYDHWWEGKSHDWVLVGPVFGRKFTKNITGFIRVGREYDILDEKIEGANSFRTGVIINF